MGKFRIRSKKGKKGRERWAKGQSGATNPSKTKFRDAAKARLLRGQGFGQQKPPTDATTSLNGLDASAGFVGGGVGGRDLPAKLTAECLLRHEAVLGQTASSVAGSTVRTSDTFASDWSGCTNMSFGKLLTRFSASNAHHKEMLAILAAVTEVIKSNGGEETSTEYLAALLTTLESAETEQSLSASIALIALVIKTVPRAVLLHQFDAISKLLLKLLAHQAEVKSTINEGSTTEGGTMTVRSLLSSLSVLLRAQSADVWNQSSGMGPPNRVFDSILSFCLDPKPRVRKSAHQAIISVLKGSTMMKPQTIQGEEDLDEDKDMQNELLEEAPPFHPAAHYASKYCISQMEKYASGQSLNDGNSRAVLHIMSLLKDIISVFPKSHVQSSCETVLKVMTSGDTF